MANTAFGHDATLTTPGSTTDTALVRWANTSGTSLNNTINILSDGSNITLNARGEVRFSDADSTHYIAFESPATVGTSYTMTLPADLPAADEVLTVTSYSSGAGVLEWAAAAGGPSQAVQSAIEAETNEDTYLPPDLVKNSPGVAKAWARIAADGTLASPNYNITSTSKVSTGRYNVTIATDFSDEDFVVVGMADDSNEDTVTGRSTVVGGWDIEVRRAGTLTDIINMSVGFGDL